jgi:hypothetical protein
MGKHTRSVLAKLIKRASGLCEYCRRPVVDDDNGFSMAIYR